MVAEVETQRIQADLVVLLIVHENEAVLEVEDFFVEGARFPGLLKHVYFGKYLDGHFDIILEQVKLLRVLGWVEPRVLQLVDFQNGLILFCK